MTTNEKRGIQSINFSYDSGVCLSVEITLDGDASLDEVIRAFEAFLSACTYQLDDRKVCLRYLDRNFNRIETPK